ncbi:MAG TPA: hypothetical protein DCQ86_02135, partial [Succinivibrio sp.]|nr:hypothetical protein [Succinivibrio sp.]
MIIPALDLSGGHVVRLKQGDFGQKTVFNVDPIKRIYDAVIERRDIANFARVVSKEEVIANDYNLNIPRYVSATEETEDYELYSLMTGGISDKELNKFSDFWDAFPTLKD